MDGWIIIPSVTRTMIDCGANEADDQRNYKPLKKNISDLKFENLYLINENLYLIKTD